MSQLLSSKGFEVSDSYLAYPSTHPGNIAGTWGDTSPMHSPRGLSAVASCPLLPPVLLESLGALREKASTFPILPPRSGHD